VAAFGAVLALPAFLRAAGRLWLQVDRAAVLPLYHPLRWLFDYGHSAVQYFWAVSGFVFAHVYLADSSAMRRFWLARVARLWPLHLLTLVLVAGLQAAYTRINGTAFIYHEQDWKHFLLSLPSRTIGAGSTTSRTMAPRGRSRPRSWPMRCSGCCCPRCAARRSAWRCPWA
jgi:hypothetical protein